VDREVLEQKPDPKVTPVVGAELRVLTALLVIREHRVIREVTPLLLVFP
jgi:hypothetical protein